MTRGDTSNYYGGMDTSSTSNNEQRANDQGGQSLTSSSGNDSNKGKELEEVGRNTLMALLCLISNVASRSYAAREFILAIQLPAQEGNNDGNASVSGIYDGSLEILFSLLTVVSLPPGIRGMAFNAIAGTCVPRKL